MKTESVFGADKACLAGEPETAFEIGLKHFKKEYDSASRELFIWSGMILDGLRRLKENFDLMPSCYNRKIMRAVLQRNRGAMVTVLGEMKEIGKLMKELMEE